MLPLEFTVLSKQIILNSNTASNYVVCYQLGLLEIQRKCVKILICRAYLVRGKTRMFYNLIRKTWLQTNVT